MFEIEKILDKRKKDGRVEFCIKWKGDTLSKATWEPRGKIDAALPKADQGVR